MTVVDAKLARWILARSATPVTHLKLQKLCFYGYGIARAFGGDLGGVVEFRAWKHGPVCVSVYEAYKGCGSSPIEPPADRLPYDAATERVLDDVLTVYGALSAWDLRNQSHLERPWSDANHERGDVIPDDAIVRWFEGLYARDGIVAPALLVGANSARIDGIPQVSYPSFADLAERIRRRS